jgi:hypothetical protein
MNVSSYIERQSKRLNTPFVITNKGEGYFKENGILYTREQFYRRYPLPHNLTQRRENIDGTKSWLDVK